MLYGLYLSATGVMTNSYRQDVIANNLANSETAGFKKNLATFRERATAAVEDPSKQGWTDPLLEGFSGGTFADPTVVDTSPGSYDRTGNPLDAAIDGSGFFTVEDQGQARLTRDGQFLLDNQGNLVTADGQQHVLDNQGNPIKLDGALIGSTRIMTDGSIVQGDKTVAKLNVVDVIDPRQLTNAGGNMFNYPNAASLPTSTTSIVQGETVEGSNVDPATELTELMRSQRDLEANANMIHYQDATLDKLINTVGKVS